MGREAALTRLRFNSARPWFQRRFTHRGRNVINAVAGNIPSAAEAPGLGEGGTGGWSLEWVPGRAGHGTGEPFTRVLCPFLAHGRVFAWQKPTGGAIASQTELFCRCCFKCLEKGPSLPASFMALLLTWPRKPFGLIALILMFSWLFAAAISPDRARVAGLVLHAPRGRKRRDGPVLRPSQGPAEHAHPVTSNCLISREQREPLGATAARLPGLSWWLCCVWWQRQARTAADGTGDLPLSPSARRRGRSRGQGTRRVF